MRHEGGGRASTLHLVFHDVKGVVAVDRHGEGA